jgi:hypothetical protein
MAHKNKFKTLSPHGLRNLLSLHLLRQKPLPLKFRKAVNHERRSRKKSFAQCSMLIRTLASLVIILLALSFPVPLFATVVFSEVMYDLPGSDSGGEWVEIHNSGTETIDLNGWKFSEGGVNHKLVPFGEALVPPSGYAVFADNPEKFFLNHPDFSGTLFDSSFSLSNIGEVIVLRDSSLTDVASASYDKNSGGAGDGNSLALLDGVWAGGMPTPGLPNRKAPRESKNESVETRNLASPSVVLHDDSPKKEPLNAVSQETGNSSGVSQAANVQNQTGGLIIWLVLLFSVVALGLYAIFAKKKKGISGYTIIEEKS